MGIYVGKKINANYINKSTYVGCLYFFEEYYEYKADAVNSKINLGKIYYKEIKKVSNANTLAVIPNSLIVELSDGRKLRYVVIKRKEVKKFLELQIEKFRE